MRFLKKPILLEAILLKAIPFEIQNAIRIFNDPRNIPLEQKPLRGMV